MTYTQAAPPPAGPGPGPNAARHAAQALGAAAGPAPLSSPTDANPLGRWLACLLDQLGCGLLLVDAQAQVHYVNRAAQQQLDAEHPLLLAGRQLQTRHDHDLAPLQAALSAASQGHRRLVSLGLARQGATVSVVPLPGGPCAHPARILLVLGAPRASLSAAALDLGRCVGLTPAEGRVLALLCEGLRPAEIARCQNVAVSTVRTQIGSARHKAGAASIRDLVRQVAVLPPLS